MSDWWARLLALYGAVTATTSVIVTVVLWRRSGARPKVRVHHQKYGYRATVINKGRSPLVVKSVGFVLPDKKRLHYGPGGQLDIAQGSGPTLQATIPAGDNASWNVQPEWDLYDAGYDEGTEVKVQPFVLFGTLKYQKLRRKLRFTSQQMMYATGGPVPRTPIDWTLTPT